jgi:hypothetical protein
MAKVGGISGYRDALSAGHDRWLANDGDTQRKKKKKRKITQSTQDWAIEWNRRSR